ncbi:MAG: electron transport complex subunit E [Oscillospiraceae bacterium]|nr:electron transport complex subunit E [Oscillospiraceae bacterium]
MSNFKEFTKGIIKENPVLVLLLGTCPTLALTTQVSNAIGMGLATTFVLVCSNLVISLLRKFIPDAVRLPCFIVIIAGFVTLVDFLLAGFAPWLYDALGVFLSLITVNCIVLGRAEMFACKNKPLPAVMDGLGMGTGFTLALVIMATIREILGSGSWLGLQIPFIEPIGIFTMSAGGFFTFGIVIALASKLSKKSPPKNMGCAGCPNAANCAGRLDAETDLKGCVE